MGAARRPAILVAAGACRPRSCWDDARDVAASVRSRRPPFADGRLHLRVDLTDERTELQYHSVDDAIVFVVYPSDEAAVSCAWKDAGTRAELERL